MHLPGLAFLRVLVDENLEAKRVTSPSLMNRRSALKSKDDEMRRFLLCAPGGRTSAEHSLATYSAFSGIPDVCRQAENRKRQQGKGSDVVDKEDGVSGGPLLFG